MKHLFLLLLLTGSALHAQVQRGDLLLTFGTGLRVTPVPQPFGVAHNLAQLITYPGEASLIGVTPSLTYLLSDRWAVGGDLGVIGTAGTSLGFNVAMSLSPHIRYYFTNREKLMLYGELGPALVTGSDRDTRLGISPEVGLHLPLGGGILLSPALSLTTFGEGVNVGIRTGLEIVLGRNEPSDSPAVVSLRRGLVMLGASSAGIGYSEEVLSLSLFGTAHYFLSDRIAVGGRLRAFTFRDTDRSADQRGGADFVLGLGGRYYLTADRPTHWFADAGLDFSSDFVAAAVGVGGQRFLRSNLALEYGLAVQFGGRLVSTLVSPSLGVRILLNDRSASTR